MRIKEILTESSNLLYHKTTVRGLNGIVRSGQIDVSGPENVDPDFDYDDYGNISFTRNPEWYHFNDEANAVTIAVDAEAVRRLSDVKSHAWQSQHNVGPAHSEQEERIAQSVPFTQEFIKSVRVDYNQQDLDPRVVERIQSLGIPIDTASK